MKSAAWRPGAVTVIFAAVSVAFIGTAAAAAQQTPRHAQVFLLQGTPGASVDVSVDGHMVKRGVHAKEIVGPLNLAPGRHMVKFQSGKWVVPASFRISKPSTDVVLHLPAEPSAKPVVTVFNNDVQPVAPGKGRLVIAHTAVVPPADVRVNGKVLFSNIANGEFIGAVVPAQTYSADIVPTGQDKPLFGPVDISVKAGALTRIFAIGQPTHGGMDAIVQVLPLKSSGSSQPSHVDTGSAGLVATPAESAGQTDGFGQQLVTGLAALLVLCLVIVLRRRIVR
jgi:uncharacterized protein DUF4397